MRQTAAELDTLLTGMADADLARRPAADAWSVTEILCHLRDVEEFYCQRVLVILAHRDPALTVFDPERWVTDRQYARCEGRPALAAFTRNRRETLTVLDALTDDEWERGGSHAQRGWMTIRRVVHGWAKHDGEHIEQIRRALAGLP